MTLVVDTGRGGHRHLHLKFLFNCLLHKHRRTLEGVQFYVSREIAEETNRELDKESAAVFREHLMCADPGRGSAALQRILAAATSIMATHVLFLDIDPFLYTLARYSFAQVVSGVWFRPNYHYSSSGLLHEGPRQHLVGELKRVVAKRLCARKNIHRLFVFDAWAETFSTVLLKTDKIRYLPDPSAFTCMAAGPPIRREHAERYVFALVGSLSRRKGILTLLDALLLLSADEQEKIEVRIVGRTIEEDRHRIANAISRARSRTGVKIAYSDCFVPDEAIDLALLQSDVVLLLYQRFIGSSGILIRAALHGRPVVSTRYGLVGATVKRHQLGSTVDPYNASEIADVMRSLVARGCLDFNADSARRFATQHAPEQYATELSRAIAEVAAVSEPTRESVLSEDRS